VNGGALGPGRTERWRWLAAAALGALALLAQGQPAPRVDLRAFADDSPPYNFLDGGVATGLSSDFLRVLCREAELTCAIEIVPWARAYYRALTDPDTLVFTATRTPEREASFLWLGPILPRSEWVYGLADGPTLGDLAALRQHRVGVIYQDAVIADLLRAGVPQASLDMAPNALTNTKKLLARRVDFVVGTDLGMAWELRQLGADAGVLRRVVPVSQEGAYYYALNPRTDPALVERLRQAFDRLERRHLREALVRDYGGAAPGRAPR
jgi:polar amino acid transport system substrate-binding protein